MTPIGCINIFGDCDLFKDGDIVKVCFEGRPSIADIEFKEFQTFKLLIQRCWDRRNAHVRFGLSLTKCLIPDRYSFCLVNPYSECKPDPDT